MPARVQEYSKRYRMLAATYITFSPDGHDLLVNLGGEQIYLYNVNYSAQSYRLETASSESGTSRGCHSNTSNDNHGESSLVSKLSYDTKKSRDEAPALCCILKHL